LRVIGSGLRAVLVGLVLAAALGPAAANASAEVLVNQPPGPSGVGLPSDGSLEWEGAFDDFDVPTGTHWGLEAIEVFGSSAIQRPRTFNVRIYRGGGGSFPIPSPDERVFSETVTVAGGPNYLIPIEGPLPLDHPNFYESGQYWIAVQAQSAGGEDDWSWLTGPDTPGTSPASLYGHSGKPEGAEPGLAFQLLGTEKQILRAFTEGAGTIVSKPPGISCPGACVAEFPQGTTITLTPSALMPSVEFTQWGFLHAGFTGPASLQGGAVGPPLTPVPIQVPTPCSGTTGTCAFTLSQDERVEANFAPINKVDILRLVRDRRAGRAELIVWVPGEGRLLFFSPGLRSYLPGSLPAGIARIPLIPTKKIAKTLRRKGHATVSAEVNFRAAGVSIPTVTQLAVTLVRKLPRKPAHRVH
jgi:hypothetical protein